MGCGLFGAPDGHSPVGANVPAAARSEAVCLR